MTYGLLPPNVQNRAFIPGFTQIFVNAKDAWLRARQTSALPSGKSGAYPLRFAAPRPIFRLMHKYALTVQIRSTILVGCSP